jgi:hypothetical protein
MSILDESVSLLAETRARFDPSAADGFSFVFNNEVKVAFPSSAPRIIRFRVLTKEDSGTTEAVRFELTSESDLRFYLVSSFDSESFQELAKAYKLRVAFDAFAQSVKELLTKSVTSPKDFQIEFRTEDGANGDLVFIQILRLRRVAILGIAFRPAPDSFVVACVQHRFNSLRMELQQASQEYQALTARLEEKNPTLGRQVRKFVETSVLPLPQ